MSQFFLLAALTLLSSNIFADVPAPSPKRFLDDPAGYQWGTIIGGGLFVVAGVLIVVWVLSKLSKRTSK